MSALVWLLWQRDRAQHRPPGVQPSLCHPLARGEREQGKEITELKPSNRLSRREMCTPKNLVSDLGKRTTRHRQIGRSTDPSSR